MGESGHAAFSVSSSHSLTGFGGEGAALVIAHRQQNSDQIHFV
jgi:hypothetical protein